MSDDNTTLQDLEEEQDQREPEPKQDQAAPAIVASETPAPAIAGPNVPREITPEAPAITPNAPAPAEPAALPITPRAAPAITPIAKPAPAAPALNPNSVAAQNPFNVLLAKEENIHNPFARVLAKVATHVGKGLETYSPDYQQTVAARAHAAEVPSIIAERQAQTANTQAEAQARAAEAARIAAGQTPLDHPIPIYGAPGSANAGEQIGEEGRDKYGNFRRDMFPTAGPGANPAGPAALPPNSSVAGAPAASGGTSPAGGPAGPATTTLKPQEPQRAPLPTPAEAAKLAPVGNAADTYNQKIKGILGKEAKDYSVDPTTSHEDAEKTLADARARANEIARDKSAERAANAPDAAQDRKDQRLMGYAVDQNGQLAYMSKADADKIHSTFEEVKATEVNKDRQAIRQLNDVQQNVSRYRTAQNAIKENISPLAASNMAAILSDKGIGAKIEPFGVGLDLGQVNDVVTNTEKASVWNSLSVPERQLVTSYLRAKSSVIAYQKALTGIGRTNKEQLDIEMQQLPTPYVGASVANEQLDAFQENIDRAAEGFPMNLPGLKSPAQIRKESENPKASAAPAKEPTRPSNVPSGYKWDANGPKGPGWYK
jgi:hypothetical protein